MIRIVGVGDNTVDKYLHLGKMFPGGNAVNVPVLAQRYGHRGSYIGCLGRDVHGDLILHALTEEGVDISHCRVLEGPNAFCEVSVVNGERIFGEFSVGVRDQINLNDDDLVFIKLHNLAHTSIYSFTEPYLRQIRDASGLLSFDFSDDWDKAYLKEILPQVDIAFLSYSHPDQDELARLIAWAQSLGPSVVLITQGEGGAFAFDGNKMYHQPSMEVEIVDSLGAGDAFAARFIVEYVQGNSIEVAMAEAARSAAETCSYYGAFGNGVSL